MREKNEEYSLKAWCEVVAFLINCDEIKLEMSNKIRTGGEIWHSNSKGELMGVLSAINLAKNVYKASKSELSNSIQKILEEKKVDPDKKFFTGYGLACCTLLWNCSLEFEKDVEAMLDRLYGPRKESKTLTT